MARLFARGARVLLVVGAVSLVASATVRAAPVRTLANRISTNWAGAIAVGTGSTERVASTAEQFTDVTGTWRVPHATCNPTNASSVAVWVGLGGYSVTSGAIEQAGVSVDCQAGGSASYYAWYELVPADSVTMPLTVRAGDLVTASVVFANGGVVLQVINRTRRQRFTKQLPVSRPDLSSAEWIGEAPSECVGPDLCRQTPLTRFGTIHFGGAYAIGNGVPGTIASPSWTSVALDLIPKSRPAKPATGETQLPNPGAAGALTSPLVPSGHGFSLSWSATPRTSS